MPKISGKTVSDCFKLVARYGAEIDALSAVLENMLAENLRSDKNLNCVQAGDSSTVERCDESSWVWTDHACYLPLKSKGKRKTERYFGFQISMIGDGIAVPGNEEPLLHVFCWDIPVSFSGEDESYVGFPPSEHEDLTVVANRLMCWGAPNSAWNERQWTYSLRLLSINSIEDVNKYITSPAIALLKGGDAKMILPDEWLDEALVRYPATL